jgi:hypothetical protein
VTDGEYAIERLTAEQAEKLLPELVALLQDSVNDGASVGFLRRMYEQTGWVRAGEIPGYARTRTERCTARCCCIAGSECSAAPCDARLSAGRSQTGRGGTCQGCMRLRSSACRAAHSAAGSIATRKSD